MSEHFETQLRLQLRAAAQREERRGALARRLAHLRLSLPAAPIVAAATVAVALLAVVVVVGGLRWGGDQPVTAPRVVADVAIADNLGYLSSGSGAVWAADPAQGQILRLDPRSRRVLARIPAGGEAIVTAGAGAVWAVNERNRLLRIDPTTNRITARVALRLPNGAPFSTLDLQILGGAPWVVGLEGALRIDARDGHVQGFTPLPQGDAEPLFVIGSVDSLWVLTREQRLERYALGTGRKTGELPVRLPGAIAVLPTPAGPVYLTREGEIARADAGDGRIAWRRKLGTSVNGLPILRGTMLWSHASDAAGRDRLVELDLDSGEVRSSAPLPQFGASGAAFVGRQVWIATPGGRLMVLQR
jgi:outer membrane protein assembly factor BamB